MEHEQLRLATLQMITTAFIALGSVLLAMGISNMNYSESSLLSLLQFETQVILELNPSSELLENIELLRNGIDSRLEQAHFFMIMGLGILSTGIIIGSVGLFSFKKSSD